MRKHLISLNMKRYLIIFSLLIAGLTLYAQGPSSAIFGATVTNADTVLGTAAKDIVLPQLLFQEYDYSYQVIPTQISGDSLNVAISLWQSNALTGAVWTEITSARDTVTAAAGKLIEGTDAKGMRHRIRGTGISTDSVALKIHWVLKLDRLFNNQ